MVEFTCIQCGTSALKSTGHYNRAMKLGAKLFCSRVCFGLERRVNKTISQKKLKKKLYDLEYRKKNYDLIRTKKAAYVKKDYAENPEKYRQKRRTRYKYHLEYLRRPEYKAYKKQYDTKHRSKKRFGEFAEAHQALLVLENEVKKLASKYEIRLQNKTLNKSLQRSRNGQTKRSYA